MAKEDLAGFFNKYNKGYVQDLATILEFHKIKRQKLENVARIYRIDVGNIEEIDVKKLFKSYPPQGAGVLVVTRLLFDVAFD